MRLADKNLARWACVDSGPGGLGSPALMRSRPCPICGSLSPNHAFLEFSNYQFFSDDPVDPKRVDVRNVICTTCFAAYLDPVYTPAGFSTLFAEAGQSYGASQGRVEEQLDWMQARGMLDQHGSLLDIGCYDGELLAALPTGVKRMGVDIDSAAIQRARQRLGDAAELVVGDFEQFDVPSRPDAITMFHVLEHLPRPVEVLARLRDMSHDRTRLVVEVPVVEGRPTNDLVGFFTVQHTTHFSRHSLLQCLARAGWAVVEHVSQRDYNGDRVLCRPSEKAPRASGDPHDLIHVREALGRWNQAVVDISTRLLAALDGVDRCLVWGAGMHLEHLYAATPLFGSDPARRYMVVDSDPVKQGSSWRGVDVLPPDALSDPECDGVPLVVSSYGSQPEIVEAARERGVAAELIVTLYDAVSVY
jgi:SAM-dependent methyltransferase